MKVSVRAGLKPSCSSVFRSHFSNLDAQSAKKKAVGAHSCTLYVPTVRPPPGKGSCECDAPGAVEGEAEGATEGAEADGGEGGEAAREADGGEGGELVTGVVLRNAVSMEMRSVT